MRVITLNVNGIRSAAAKGLFPWLAKQKADVICLQEVRATEEQLKDHDVSLPGLSRRLPLGGSPRICGCRRVLPRARRCAWCAG